MPVATRSHSLSSPRAPDGEEHAGEGASWHGRIKPEHSLLRIAHCKLKQRMRSTDQSQGNPPLKTSHPSVDLFSPAVSIEKRISAAGRVFVAKESEEDNAQEKIPNLGSSPQVLAKLSWTREGDGRVKGLILERLAYSCRNPQQQQQPPPPRCAVARRLTMAGAGDRAAGGLNHLETISELGGGIGEGARIMVYVRLRPMAKKEKEAGARSCVRIVDKRDVYLTEFAMETDYLRLKRLRGRHFLFDGSFPDNTTQEEVYNATTSELVEGVLQGRNGSVFCYGATGAGKTYTMLGTIQNPGVMVLAIKDLFTKIRQRSCDGQHIVRLSYLEVYNEMVRDLLSPGRPLVLREDKQGIVAAGLTQYQAYSTDEVMALLQQGNQNRTTEPTRINETSSRSHAILQVVAEYKVKEGCSIVTRAGKLSLIDLAGSERALATDQRTLRSLEGANINRSLLALSSCINALVEGKKHIPYRNSKLTQLLKDSLGGACHTVMIANISPSNLSFGETQNTLHWADRAKEIRTKACVVKEEFQPPESQSEQAKLLLEVQKENQQLRMQLARYQQKLLSIQNQSLLSSPALSSSSSLLFPTSPLTPAAAATQVRHNSSKVIQCCTPQTNPKQELSSNYTSKVAEETNIQELKARLAALEMESEQIKKESAMKEKILTSSIMALKREHTVQLRHKDDFIRKLCQKALLSNQASQKSLSHLEHEEILNSSQPSGTTVALTSTLKITNASARPLSERLINIVPPKPVGSKTSSLSQNVSNPSLRTGGRTHLENAVGDLKSPSQSQRFSSPATGKKRTYWDITNGNSPSAAQSRSTRSHTAVDAPSMLLQPGFAHHRPSLN